MQQVKSTFLFSVLVLMTSGCQDQVVLPELMPEVARGEPDPYYRGTEHIRMADAVVVALIKKVVAQGKPYPSKFSREIYLQATELVIEPEYVIKGKLPGATLSVRANLLSYVSTRALGYRPFKPEPGQRWTLFLRRENDWRMLFDLFQMGIRVYSGTPDPAIVSRFGDVAAQTAAILVTPGPKFVPSIYCDGLSGSTAYARLLVGPEETLRILESIPAVSDGCVQRVLFEEIESIRQHIYERRRRPE